MLAYDLLDSKRKMSQRKWKHFPGSNRFYCNGLLMSASQMGVLLFLIILLIVMAILFFSFEWVCYGFLWYHMGMLWEIFEYQNILHRENLLSVSVSNVFNDNMWLITNKIMINLFPLMGKFAIRSSLMYMYIVTQFVPLAFAIFSGGR